MRRIAALIVAFTFAAAGCVGGDVVTGDRRNVGVVSVVFSARPARVRVGQAVTLTLKLFNNSGETRSIEFPDKRFYDFWTDREGRETWRWSAGQVFEQMTVTVDLASQSPETYVESWIPEEPGTYRVFASVASKEYERPLGGRVIVE
jgi:hypothetical protein